MRSGVVEVVVPWRGGCPYRERAWAWVRRQYEAKHPDWDLVVTEAPPGPWVKATAVNEAVARSAADVIVVADADVWCEGLGEAVEALSGRKRWAVPHWGVHRLTELSTEQLLAGEQWLDLPCELEANRTRPSPGVRGGGIVVARRETLLEVPMDSRYVGWGQEDASWGVALACLAGAPWRGRVPLAHLWHPPQERMTRMWGSFESRALYRRYEHAQSAPTQMRRILEEITCPSPS